MFRRFTFILACLISISNAKNYFKDYDLNATNWSSTAYDISQTKDNNQTILWFGKYLGNLIYTNKKISLR